MNIVDDSFPVDLRNHLRYIFILLNVISLSHRNLPLCSLQSCGLLINTSPEFHPFRCRVSRAHHVSLWYVKPTTFAWQLVRWDEDLSS